MFSLGEILLKNFDMENMPHDYVQEVSRLVGDFMDPKGAHAQGWQMMNRDNDEVDEGLQNPSHNFFFFGGGGSTQQSNSVTDKGFPKIHSLATLQLS